MIFVVRSTLDNIINEKRSCVLQLSVKNAGGTEAKRRADGNGDRKWDQLAKQESPQQGQARPREGHSLGRHRQRLQYRGESFNFLI